jgi:2,4-dienoyl-CoA reductase (NADPH2)
VPRIPKIEGIDHPKVLSYIEVLRDKKEVGQKVAIIGAGGIGFDIATYLLHEHNGAPKVVPFMEEWGVDMDYQDGGGLKDADFETPKREIYLLQRSTGKLGAKLGKTTGWIHRAMLKKNSVNMIAQVKYEKIDDEGLHISIDDKPTILEVDHIVICAGQLALHPLADALVKANKAFHIIGGAKEARELDAKKAIKEASYLAAQF